MVQLYVRENICSKNIYYVYFVDANKGKIFENKWHLLNFTWSYQVHWLWPQHECVMLSSFFIFY